ncbi:MAG: flagellar hook basal-body protein [Planctomycetes bacterium]|nr:flagellar hook basal-body protein [Planctomycetota bacterium]
MGWTRHTGTVAALAVLASVVANYAVHSHFGRLSHRQAATAEASATPLFLDFPATEPASEISAIPRCLDEEVGYARPLSAVTAALETSETGDSSNPDKLNPVPAPLGEDDATAKAPKSARPNAVRKVIDDELSGSSVEERDIWFEELKSLPAGVVRDLLQVRKQLRSLPRALHRKDLAQSVPAPHLVELTADPVSQIRRQPLPDWVPTMAALEQACSIDRHNLANSTTPGFKRLRVMLVDAYGVDWPTETADADPVDPNPTQWNSMHVDGCRLGPSLLDLKQGKLQQTRRELDLAIDGAGFFVATRNNETIYTRCGAMVLDAQRRICLTVADGAVVEPVMTVPADASEIQVAADGTVSVLTRSDEVPVAIGQLVLAQFPSPHRLRPIGGTLLSPTDASGKAEAAVPMEGGRGGILQSCLEQSNVDADEELAEIESWQTILKSFPSVSRPVTASGQEPRSR